MLQNITYVSPEEFESECAAMRARVQAARLKRFAGKVERNWTINVLSQDVLGNICTERRTIRGFTKQDALDQAGIR